MTGHRRGNSSRAQAEQWSPDTSFVGSNVVYWAKVAKLSIERLHNRVHERTGKQAVKMIAHGHSPGEIANLIAIARELGVRLQDITREPADSPKALSQFLESPLAPKKDSPDAITPEELDILARFDIPRRRMTPECYYLALQIIRKAEPEQ